MYTFKESRMRATPILYFTALLSFHAVCGQQPIPVNTDESKVAPYTLPDLLASKDGSTIADEKAWREIRRPELLELFKVHMYGRSPGKPENLAFKVVNEYPNALDGKAIGKHVDITVTKGEKSLTIHVNLFIPRQPRPAPAFLLICNRPSTKTDFTRPEKSSFWPVEDIVARGYAAVAFYNADVDPDKDDGFKDGIHGLLDGDTPRAPDAWGTLSAWAWGASRVLDYLETDSAIDAKRVAITGHSRCGKTALWAGAQDERFAMAISNESGCTGAALSRRDYGETLAHSHRSFPYWFCDNFKNYVDKQAEIPVDQHMLIALLAPRPVYVASAEEDTWADPKGEYLGLYHASPVYQLFNFKVLASVEPPPLETPAYGDRQGYHIRPGKHALIAYDWQRFMDFADKVWKK